MKLEKKEKINKAYTKHDDRAIMWADGKIDLRVYLTDVKALVTKVAVCGNVINAYAEVLLTKQMAVAANQETIETSYFFSSICLGMFGNNNESSCVKYVLDNMNAAQCNRYIHFPICHKVHWTLIVYDTEVGVWKHYNPLRPRNGGCDIV